MAEALSYACMFCGKSIEGIDVDPCSALLVATWPDNDFDDSPGQYYFHAACLRRVMHPSAPPYFLDIGEDA